MKYAQIREYDVANGTGIRCTIFLTGCNFACEGCFNEEYQEFNYGLEWTDKTTQELSDKLGKTVHCGLSILGGEPFEHSISLKNMLDRLNTNKNVWIWSGYTFEAILNNPDKLELLKRTDVLVDGLFVESKKDLNLKFRGSSNQRVIDVQQSLKQNKMILWEI